MTDIIDHEHYMRLAIKLALKAKGQTSPNPIVGAVVVKDGVVVGRGYHKMAGENHAEVIALTEADGNACDSRLYVTLEPCQHFGKTPPCVDKIIEGGVKEVIIATRDPNPVNNGKGILKLRQNRIGVIEGVLKKEAERINEVFNKYIITGLPFIIVKVAQSLDGKIATAIGESKWLTSDAARRYVHRLRSKVDAVLVGVNTVLKDDPLLTARYSLKLIPRLRSGQAAYSQKPIKIILDSNLRTPPDARIFSGQSPAPVIISAKKNAPRNRIKRLKERGAKILFSKSLYALMKQLANLEISSILIEGGGETIASALVERLVDKMFVFIAPKLIGGRNAPTSVEGDGIVRIGDAIRLRDICYRRFGQDLLIEGYPDY